MTNLIFEKDFRAAAAEWLESRKLHLKPRTYLDYGYYIDQLNPYFGDQRLHEITGDMVRAYQKTRRATECPGVINEELGVLKMMRERIGLPLQDYQRLPVPKNYESPGRALTEGEQQILEQVVLLDKDGHTDFRDSSDS
jgi:hypothetical protein